jgi:hypothetical protein
VKSCLKTISNNKKEKKKKEIGISRFFGHMVLCPRRDSLRVKSCRDWWCSEDFGTFGYF